MDILLVPNCDILIKYVDWPSLCWVMICHYNEISEILLVFQIACRQCKWTKHATNDKQTTIEHRCNVPWTLIINIKAKYSFVEPEPEYMAWACYCENMLFSNPIRPQWWSQWQSPHTDTPNPHIRADRMSLWKLACHNEIAIYTLIWSCCERVSLAIFPGSPYTPDRAHHQFCTAHHKTYNLFYFRGTIYMRCYSPLRWAYNSDRVPSQRSIRGHYGCLEMLGFNLVGFFGTHFWLEAFCI